MTPEDSHLKAVARLYHEAYRDERKAWNLAQRAQANAAIQHEVYAATWEAWTVADDALIVARRSLENAALQIPEVF